nr:MAG TPA: Nucleotide modification associated domain 1 [Crassvirales sp.]
MERTNDRLENIIDQIEDVSNSLSLEEAEILYNIIQELNDMRHIFGSESGEFRDITNSMIQTYQAKNQDYGNSFEKTLDRFGLVTSIIRLSDKMNRIESLSQKKAKVESESIEDTLLDLANYAIMTVIWLRKNRINEE